MTDHTTTTPKVTTFTHETVTLSAFRSYMSACTDRKSVKPILVLIAPYYNVEYLNSPKGLIVLAHQNTDDGQVDGIHPTTISEAIMTSRNIIEPLKSKQSGALEYNVHYMTRRSQGTLILEAFGRMINGGDEEAISISTEKFFKLEFYNTNLGLVIGVIEGIDRVCIIRPNELQDTELGCEVVAA